MQAPKKETHDSWKNRWVTLTGEEKKRTAQHGYYNYTEKKTKRTDLKRGGKMPRGGS